ncbi:UDP-glucose 4-epimerase [Hyphomonas neptunium ATCC 15444]|uniref:UDP-glucose 4-epimerase n=1 Tax=Hyphomonas neptunium (strain ATCC 15444) TaxID=228405 RepID=Q0C2X5_HYPNA|nr:UDP-glucose 4-epimerase GalE [Hyphomonas neptunium]ABI77821.1 UDP-glucose 4-epimerase [Hyphomonas neptunium ATCC 15444]
MPGKVLVLGGAGYVGSHCCRAFSEAGWDVTVFDNLSTGWRDLVRWGKLIEGDLNSPGDIEAAFSAIKPDAVAHFAASTLVGESVTEPGKYYRNNTFTTLNVLDAMQRHNTRAIIFSSTCAIFGHAQTEFLAEDHPKNPINPYGMSKLMVEQMLAGFDHAHGIRSACLRYFNAAGADRQALTGERHACETHLIPLALKGAYDPGYSFTITGTDFDTPDGTALRDYIHVEDLAEAHLLALNALEQGAPSNAFNLGTGRGTSVAEIVDAVERATGRRLPRKIGPRRPGDAARLIAAPGRAKDVLGWTAKRSDVDNIITSALAWHQKDWAQHKEDSLQG